MSFLTMASLPLVDIPLYLAIKLHGLIVVMAPHPDCTSAHQGAKQVTPQINTGLGYGAIVLGLVIIVAVFRWGATSNAKHLQSAGGAVGALILIGGVLFTLLSSFGITTCL